MFYISILWYLYYISPILTRFVTTFTIVINLTTKYFIIYNIFIVEKFYNFQYTYSSTINHILMNLRVFIHNRKDKNIKRLFYATVHPPPDVGTVRPKTCKSWNIITLLWFWQIVCICWFTLWWLNRNASSSSSHWTFLIAESFGLLNDLRLPFLSILDASCPIFYLHLANVLFDVILPSVCGSSLWSFDQGFPIKCLLNCSGIWPSLHVTKPA